MPSYASTRDANKRSDGSYHRVLRRWVVIYQNISSSTAHQLDVVSIIRSGTLGLPVLKRSFGFQPERGSSKMAVQTLTVAEVSGLIAAAVMVGRIPSSFLSARECIAIHAPSN